MIEGAIIRKQRSRNMDLVKRNKDIEIFKKGSGRYAILDRKTGKYINGEEKFKLLVNHKLSKVPAAKPKAEKPAEAAETPAS